MQVLLYIASVAKVLILGYLYKYVSKYICKYICIYIYIYIRIYIYQSSYLYIAAIAKVRM